MSLHTKCIISISLILIVVFVYPDADALTIYILRVTIADHETHVVRSFNVLLYDYDNDHKVILDIPHDILGVIEHGCGTLTLSFPGFYTCGTSRMTVDLHSSSGFIVTFI